MLVWALLSALLSLALLPSSTVAQGPQLPAAWNTSNPSVLPHAAQSTMQQRLYPGCAANKHLVATKQPSTQFYQLGGQTGTDQYGNPIWNNAVDFAATAAFDVSSTKTFTPAASGFSSFKQPNVTGGNSAIARVSPGMVVLPNNGIVLMGGKIASSWALTNDVIMSADGGNTWMQSTAFAPWNARSDMSVDIEPNTGNIVLCGGELLNFVYQADCWLSTDGMGASWTKQQYTFSAAFQEAPMTFMYDGSATTAASLVLYNPSDDNVYRSTDRANSWAKVSNFASLGYPQQTGRMVADADGNLYMAGGVNENNQIFFSSDKGTTWSQMGQITFYPGARIADAVQVSAFTYGCLAINYISAPAVPGSYRKQLIQFAGTLQAAADTQSWFQCSFTSSAQYTSIVNELILPGETVFQALGQTPNFTQTASLVFHDGSSTLLTPRLYPDCTYDNHAAITRSSTVKAWQFGGFSPSSGAVPTYINTTDYSATGNWNNYQTLTGVTYSNSPGQSGKAGAGVVYLSSKLLLLFGGKDALGAFNTNSGGGNIGVTNDVFTSADNGQTWTIVNTDPGWVPRSDMSYACNPGTDYVLMGGGQTNPNYLNVADMWSTNDQGKTWQLMVSGSQWGGFQDAAMVFMYDNDKAQNTGKTFGTLLLNTGVINPALNQDAIWRSTDGGATFTRASIAPWTQRLRNNFVADMENNVYMAGGLQVSADVWMSADFGNTWTLMAQTPTQPGPYNNVMSFQGAQQNCMSLRYFPNSNSPGGYHKQLTMYGSNNMITVAQQSAPECVTQMTVNVLYGEIMQASEIANANFADTSVPAPPANSVPTLNLNGPASLMPQRWYPDCGYDVHAALRGQSPMSYAMGGTDPNYIALPTLDRFSGSSINQFQTVYPVMRNGFVRGSSSRWAAGVAVLNNGNVLWFGGKSPSFVILNDVVYSTDQGSTFNMSAIAAWPPRSDMGVASIPGTNCVLVTMGSSYSASYNDVWSSCDGYGASWTQQSAALPWAPANDPSIVALYQQSGTPDQSNPTNTILLYTTATQYIYSSTNMGKTWSAGMEVPWAARATAKLLADKSNGVYLVGGASRDIEQGGNGAYGVTVPDVWFSYNSGANWVILKQATNAGYYTPVTLQLADYSCASVNYRGNHRQLVLYSGTINVYNSNQVQQTGAWWNQPTCTCTSQTGVRALLGDLLWPGETADSNNGASDGLASNGGGVVGGGGGNKFSSGATAGIAVGVGVGVALLCLLGMVFCFGAGRASKKSTSGEGKANGGVGGNHSKFENETSTNQSVVEMNNEGRPAEV